MIDIAINGVTLGQAKVDPSNRSASRQVDGLQGRVGMIVRGRILDSYLVVAGGLRKESEVASRISNDRLFCGG